MMLKFSGHHALILGGTCELGLAVALKLIEAGLHPILTYRNASGMHIINEWLYGLEGKYAAVPLDLGDRKTLDVLFQQHLRQVDFLVDFAQGDYESLVASADEQEIGRYFDENVSVRAGVIKRAARLMLVQKKGRMIYISSAAAARPNPGQGFYAAAKLASEALYRNLGLELGGRGVTTVILRPAYVDAGRGRQFLKTHGPSALNKMPDVRPLSIREVVEAIMFYLSDSASGFNAVEIPIGGGK